MGGLGHAVLCAREWVGSEPFLLLLGDYIYQSHCEVSRAGQLVGAYDKARQNIVGLADCEGQQLRDGLPGRLLGLLMLPLPREVGLPSRPSSLLVCRKCPP